MRVLWLVVGVIIGLVTMCLLLPLCSDSTGTIESLVVVACLLGGLLAGFVLDDWHRRNRTSK